LAKEELIEFEGSVLELLPDARFRVRLDNGHETLAYSSGRMKKNRIRILAGDASTSATRTAPRRRRWPGRNSGVAKPPPNCHLS
jgi:translation initiation factor IF-1